MGNSPPKRAAAVRELERFTYPTGVYPSCPWDVRIVRRLILEKRIAPRFPGRDSSESCFTQECPICFMFYPGVLNTSQCCKKPICSECYLQVKPPNKQVSCPYCNRESFGIKYTAPAVMNLSSIYTEDVSANAIPTPPMRNTRASPPRPRTPNINITPSVQPPTVDDSALHFASVEDRERIRDDLRSQLQLTDRPLTTPAPVVQPQSPPMPPSLRSRLSSGGASFIISSAEDAARLAEPRYIIASATDAARLEEMMIMEAIRRSMRDLTVPKDEDDDDEDDEQDDDIAYGYSSASSEEDTRGMGDSVNGLEGRVGSDYEMLRQFQANP